MTRLLTLLRSGLARFAGRRPSPSRGPMIYVQICEGDGSGRYAWRAVRRAPDGWVPRDEGPAGTLEADPAIEANGHGLVNSGHIVALTREPETGALIFFATGVDAISVDWGDR
jgi:hypothetical protein